MNRSFRHVIFIISALSLGIFVFLGFNKLHDFGTQIGAYADLIGKVALEERKITNITTSVIFDYRGFDTLGEEFMIFASVAGLILLLRKEPEKKKSADLKRGESGFLPPEEALDWVGTAWVPITIIFGIYVVLHGQLTPGGGFHGGTILGSVFASVFILFGKKKFHKLEVDKIIDVADAFGAGAYILVGVAGMIAGGTFLQNVIPLGTVGSISSGGTIAVINAAVGLEVASAFALISSQFIRETRAYRIVE